jgi:hypothetical protein
MGSRNQTTINRGSASKTATSDPKKSGFAKHPGPWIARVVAHVESTRMGELFVDIPQLRALVTAADGEGTVDSTGIRVSYCSPFYGTTYGTDTQLLPNSALTSGQSYGMWMVPPDIGNSVLVIFTPQGQGFWIGCIYDSPSHHMVPAIGRSVGGAAKSNAPPEIATYLNSSSNVPVVEYNTSTAANPTAYAADGLTATPRFAHDHQAMQYVTQGLDQDLIRGAISSSSLRESPSNVYGISTPGPVARPDQIPGRPQGVVARKGGHTFVMDDGDKDGVDQLIRLRTSGGHQILMNDTENILYIASKSGQQWIEFSPNGSINVYGAAGINMRSQGPMNLHSDIAIAMNAPSIQMNASASSIPGGPALGSISISSSGGISMQSITTFAAKSVGAMSLSSMGLTSLSSGAMLNLSSIGPLKIVGTTATSISGSVVNIASAGLLNLNCTPPTFGIPPIPPIPVTPKSHPDAQFNGSGWVKGGTTVDSVCTVVPGHEPWERPAKKK